MEPVKVQTRWRNGDDENGKRYWLEKGKQTQFGISIHRQSVTNCELYRNKNHNFNSAMGIDSIQPGKSILIDFPITMVLWRCWLGGRKSIRPVKNEWWGAGVVICLERGADLHMAQLMPRPLTVSCFRKIQIGFTFLLLVHLGSPGKTALKRVCVCVCVYCQLVYGQTNLEWRQFIVCHVSLSCQCPQFPHTRINEAWLPRLLQLAFSHLLQTAVTLLQLLVDLLHCRMLLSYVHLLLIGRVDSFLNESLQRVIHLYNVKQTNWV